MSWLLFVYVLRFIILFDWLDQFHSLVSKRWYCGFHLILSIVQVFHFFLNLDLKNFILCFILVSVFFQVSIFIEFCLYILIF